MCGRFSLYADFEDIAEQFDIYNMEEIEFRKRYNIAPSQDVLSIVSTERGNKVGFLKWGLIPFWAKDKKIGYKMINARAETVDEKASYKRLLKNHRCIIPASGFFEWQKRGNQKQPFHIQLKSKEPFGFAGLWDKWEKDGEVINSCTIVTTKPNHLMESIHDRMPVILTKENEEAWLDRTLDDTEYLKSLLMPYSSEEMEAYEVSNDVGSPKNQGKELVQPL